MIPRLSVSIESVAACLFVARFHLGEFLRIGSIKALNVRDIPLILIHNPLLSNRVHPPERPGKTKVSTGCRAAVPNDRFLAEQLDFVFIGSQLTISVDSDQSGTCVAHPDLEIVPSFCRDDVRGPTGAPTCFCFTLAIEAATIGAVFDFLSMGV